MLVRKSEEGRRIEKRRGRLKGGGGELRRGKGREEGRGGQGKRRKGRGGEKKENEEGGK